MVDRIHAAIAENDLDKAEHLCDELLRHNEYDLEGLYYLAIVKRKQQQFDKALTTHNSLVNLIPNNADFYAERALTYHQMQLKAEALKDFTRAIELDQANAYRYSSRAFVRDYYGDHQGALDDYNRAIELDPEDAISLNNRGVIEEKLGRLKAARKSFERSDNLSGIDQQLSDLINQPTPTNDSSIKSEKEPPRLSLGSYFATLWKLISSKDERQNFFRFLTRRK